MIRSDECAQYREWLPWYAAGTLPDTERAAVEQHLHSCDACTRELATWQTFGAGVSEAGQAIEPAPPLHASWELLSARLTPVPDIAVSPAQTQNAHGASPALHRLRWFWLVLWGQTRLLRPAMWVASAVAIALAALCSALLSRATGQSASASDLLVFALPLISSTGVSFLYGPENDPGLELGRATPTTARAVLLSRFALLFSFNAGLALLATLALMLWQGASFWTLASLWLGPMALLSALSLCLSLVFGPTISVGAISLFWLANSVRAGNGIHWEPGLLVSGWNTALLLILAVLGLFAAVFLSSRQERLRAGASNASSELPIDATTSLAASVHLLSADISDNQHGKGSRMKQSVALGGVIRYEFFMQIRRISLWVVSVLLGALSLIQFTDPHTFTHDANMLVTRGNIVVIEAAGAAGFFWLGAGLLLAGRSRRDYTTRMDEILGTTPATMLTRLFGKYIGSVLATFIPMILIYLIGVTLLALNWHDFSIFPLAMVALAAVAIPAVLFVGAFSIACTTFIWPPLYMFLFIGYYLWDSLDPKGPIPTLDGTVLSPSGRLIMTGIFHFTPFRTTDLTYYPQTSIWGGVANIVALLAAGAIALLAAWGLETWRARRR